MSELAAWLNDRIAERGLGLRRFAALAGVSPATVRWWRLGATRPTYENCAAIARVLDADAAIVRALAHYRDEGVSGAEGADLPYEERELLRHYRETDERGRQMIREVAKAARATRADQDAAPAPPAAGRRPPPRVGQTPGQ